MAKKVKIVRNGTNQSYVPQHSAMIIEGKRPKKEPSYMKDSFYGGYKMP